MPVLKRRSKIVSFRLSDEEYAAMMQSCISRGSRSLSDYARSAACHHLYGKDSPGDDGSNERSIRELKTRIEELDRRLHQLTRAVAPAGAVEGAAGAVPANPPPPPQRPARREGNGGRP